MRSHQLLLAAPAKFAQHLMEMHGSECSEFSFNSVFRSCRCITASFGAIRRPSDPIQSREGILTMFRKTMLSLLCTAALIGAAANSGLADDTINGNYAAPSAAAACPPYANPYYGAYGAAAAGNAYGQVWGGTAGARDCNRFYHYPYVYYPQNFYGSEYYRSSDSMYYRYPAEMQIPVYNKGWHNEYPSQRRFHSGHHFLTDVF